MQAAEACGLTAGGKLGIAFGGPDLDIERLGPFVNDVHEDICRLVVAAVELEYAFPRRHGSSLRVATRANRVTLWQ